MPMDLLPTEVFLQIISFLHDPKDKIELLRTNRCIHSILANTPICWSPLDLSLYREKINNAVLLSILRSRSLEIVVPKQQPLQQHATLLTTPAPHGTGTLTISKRCKAAQLDSINISGCHLLTSEAILMLVNTLPYLTKLHIDRYAATTVPEPLARHPRHYRRTRSKMIDMLRDDLYQCRPRHGLSSSTMDLSKQPLASLAITDNTLQRILVATPFLTDLSLQHQRLSMAVCRSMHKRLPYLRHLDISSCEVMSPDLQYLVRTLAGSLLSLKMLNLVLSNLTLLCLQLHGGDSLECLHLSCLDPLSLPGLARTVKSLTKLTDFRLTRLQSGNVDDLICTLAAHHPRLTSLDISPKLELYPKFVSASHPKTYPPGNSAFSTPFSATNTHHQPDAFGTIPHWKAAAASSSSSKKAPPTTKSMPPSIAKRLGQPTPSSGVTFTRSERDLHLTGISIDRLATCFPYLTELRLCFPTIDAPTLSHLFKTASCPLRILEIRLRETTPSTVDYLDGLDHLTQLHTLLLYSVPLTERSVDTILASTTVQSMTIHDAKHLGKLYPLFLRRWLLELPRLCLLRMDWVAFAWSSVADIVGHGDCLFHVNDPLYDGDSMFIKTSTGVWEWVE